MIYTGKCNKCGREEDFLVHKSVLIGEKLSECFCGGTLFRIFEGQFNLLGLKTIYASKPKDKGDGRVPKKIQVGFGD